MTCPHLTSPLGPAAVLFADRYVVEGICVAILFMIVAAANLWRLSGRVTRVEARLNILPTKPEMDGLKAELLSRIERERTVDDQLLAQANESIATLRKLNDHQFAVITQLTQRMDSYLLEELRLHRKREATASPSPMLSAA